jgi:hypothetical protein
MSSSGSVKEIMADFFVQINEFSGTKVQGIKRTEGLPASVPCSQLAHKYSRMLRPLKWTGVLNRRFLYL